jgi:hypothetical protein
MTMLKSGWIIVGSTPSTDGTTKTKGDGCLLVLDPTGKVVAAWAGPTINDPWGNMAVVDNGDKATLFISMAGFGIPGPNVVDPATGYPVIVRKATVLRLKLEIPDGKPPVLLSQTVVGDGFAQRADRDNFLFGPTGLALAKDGTLYVTDGLDNVITAIPNALTLPCRPARTTPRRPFTPSASSRAWPTASPSCAGSRPASSPASRRTRRRAT